MTDSGRAATPQALSAALLSLHADHRGVIVRACYLGQTVAEIAAHEGIAEETVKSRLHYALRALLIASQERGLVP
jgi:RNA polymerase sigma-70 factor, ECF subfamily